MKSLVSFILESKENPNFAEMQNEINKYGRIPDSKDWMNISFEEQLSLLQDSGKHFFLFKDELEAEECICYMITPTEKENLLGYIDDCLSNLVDGYDVLDENHYVIKYKGLKPIYTEDGMENSKGKQLSKVPRTNLEWVCCGLGESVDWCWYINDKAKNDMVEFMGLAEFKQRAPQRVEQGRGFEDYE